MKIRITGNERRKGDCRSRLFVADWMVAVLPHPNRSLSASLTPIPRLRISRRYHARITIQPIKQPNKTAVAKSIGAAPLCHAPPFFWAPISGSLIIACRARAPARAEYRACLDARSVQPDGTAAKNADCASSAPVSSANGYRRRHAKNRTFMRNLGTTSLRR